MQVTQNKGLHKLMGVFRMTLIEPLHNLTRIPPITYLMGKLMHLYTLRLGHLLPITKVRMVLTADQCCYWPDYLQPPTNLTRASQNLGESTYWAPSLCTARTWAHPRFIYLSEPPANITCHYAQSRERPEASDMHIYMLPTSHNSLPYATYHTTRGLAPMSHRVT